MLVIGDTAGTAYDGAAGAALEQTVRELAGGAGTMYSVYVRNNLNSLGFAANTEKNVSWISPSSPSIGIISMNRTSRRENSGCVQS